MTNKQEENIKSKVVFAGALVRSERIQVLKNLYPSEPERETADEVYEKSYGNFKIFATKPSKSLSPLLIEKLAEDLRAKKRILFIFASEKYLDTRYKIQDITVEMGIPFSDNAETSFLNLELTKDLITQYVENTSGNFSDIIGIKGLEQFDRLYIDGLPSEIFEDF